jgi:hypothetical protein
MSEVRGYPGRDGIGRGEGMSALEALAIYLYSTFYF